MTEMQLVLEEEDASPISAETPGRPGTRILGGEEALPEILRRLKGWRILALLFRIPGTGPISRVIYAWVARNRYAISCALAREPGASG